MSFPREEILGDLVGPRRYVDGIQWRVFEDLDGDMPGRNVLIVLGGEWTMVTAADFRQAADRILKQL